MLEDTENGFDARGGAAAGPVKKPVKAAEAGGITRPVAGVVVAPPKVKPVVVGGVIENPATPPEVEVAAGAPKLKPPAEGATVDVVVCALALEVGMEKPPEKSCFGPEGVGTVDHGVDVDNGATAVTGKVFEATVAELKEKDVVVAGVFRLLATAAAATVATCPFPFRLLSHDRHLVAVLLFCTKHTGHF